ncbi:MAG: hypothetical protein HC930_02915 [Hydrococcus sp. SU_1_0]|nr:hypothetical protein [Hydrococcus sp. SU_1_0]
MTYTLELSQEQLETLYHQLSLQSNQLSDEMTELESVMLLQSYCDKVEIDREMLSLYGGKLVRMIGLSQVLIKCAEITPHKGHATELSYKARQTVRDCTKVLATFESHFGEVKIELAVLGVKEGDRRTGRAVRLD